MKKLDLYIIRQFLGTFFMSIILILSIVVIFDISEKIDDFIKKEAPLRAIITDYYFNFLPYFANLFSPLFTFISVIFFTSKLANNTEIVAILSSGVSFNRLLFSYFIAAAIIATFSLGMNHWIVPSATKNIVAFKQKYIWSEYRNTNRHIHKQIKPGHFIYMETFNVQDQTGYKFSYEIINNQRLTYKLNSSQAKWDSIQQSWKVYNYVIREIDTLHETFRRGNVLDTVFDFDVNEFIEKREFVNTLNYTELSQFIDDEIMKGSERVPFHKIEMYRRTSFPFATFILTLIAVSLCSRKVRGGIGINIGIGFAISFAYILFMQVFDTFATNANTPPLLAVWIPNIIFGCLAFWLYKKDPK